MSTVTPLIGYSLLFTSGL